MASSFKLLLRHLNLTVTLICKHLKMLILNMYEMLLFLVKSSLLQCPALYAHPGSDMQNT